MRPLSLSTDTSITAQWYIVALLLTGIFTSDTSLCAAAAASVTVAGPLSVVRGTSARLDHGLYNITTIADDTDCTITHLHHTAASLPQCGIVSPSTLKCHQQNRTFTYIHYGCLNQYEMLSFRVVSRQKDGNEQAIVYIEDFSISVHVITLPSSPVLEISSVASRHDSSIHELTVYCPPKLINICAYSIPNPNTTQWLSSQSGLIVESLKDGLIPCGSSPKNPFLYKLSNRIETFDTLSILTHCVDENSFTMRRGHHIVPFNNMQHQQLLQLPKAHLRIKELGVTPIPRDLFDLKFLQNDHHYLKLTFPVQTAGGVYPVHSSKEGYLDATVFSYSSILRGEAVFVPNESSAASFVAITSQFHYYVTDISGQTIANGLLEVLSSPRLGLKPSLRRNAGFNTVQGDTAHITGSHLDFYPPSECLNYTMDIVKTPEFGSLNSDKTQLSNDDKVNIVNGNLSLSYSHHGKPGHHDVILTTIHCTNKTTVTPHEPFSVSIPIRIVQSLHNRPSMYRCSQTITGYAGFATPMVSTMKECLELSRSSATTGDSLTLSTAINSIHLFDNKRCPLNTGYTYIHHSEDVWTNCFSKISLNNTYLNEEQWAGLWYLFPSNDIGNHSNTTNNLSLMDNDGIVTYVQYNVINLLTIPEMDFVMTPVENITTTTRHPSIPYIRHNQALSLGTLDTILITSHYLYVQPLGYLQNEIVYKIMSAPLYGVVCVLGHRLCEESVDEFTQEDIVANRVYYRPSQLANAMTEDYFEFQVYYQSDVKIDGQYKFGIHIEIDEEKLTQFWVASGQSKPLLRRHLKHLQTPEIGTMSNVVFRLLHQPKNGFLQLINRTGDTFTWDNIIERSVIYHHHDSSLTVCNDTIVLSMERDGRAIITVSISVAIRYKKLSFLNIITKQHELDGGESFVISVKDLTINTGFCPQFVQVVIQRPPEYGLLILQDPAQHTGRHLSTNSTFIATNINEGHISYSLYPDVTLVEDTQDEFLFTIIDPRGEYTEGASMKRDIDRHVFSLYIYIRPIEGSGEFFNFNYSTVVTKHVMELPDNRYGAILGPSDIYFIDSELHPSEIVFQVHQSPEHGYLEKGNYQVEHFTLADIASRNISYISTLPHTNTNITEDEFRYSITVTLFSVQRKVVLDRSFKFSWCYFSMERHFISVYETAQRTNFTLRKIGSSAAFLETVAVNVSTVSESPGAIEADCSVVNVSRIGVDYCDLNVRLDFTKTVKHSVSIELFDDSVPEGDEVVKIVLSQPQGCLVPKWLSRKIFIHDSEDYSTVQFSSSYYNSNDNQCEHVAESIGTFNLTLIRTGYLDTLVGVVCYTTGLEGGGDYLHRPETDQSLVYFLPGEQKTVCPITIYDDHLNEDREYFEVHLKVPKSDFAYPNFAQSSLCVFIDHDENDEPIVSFASSVVFVQESFDTPQIVSLKITRTGSDITESTRLGCVLLPNGNADIGVDYNIRGDLQNIVIPGGASEIFVNIEVLPDLLVETTESFRIQMTDPYENGRIVSGDQTTVEVVILDAKKDVELQFSQNEFVFQETDGYTRVEFYRHGDLSHDTTVYCNITLHKLNSSDVLIPPVSETVTIPTNGTVGACSFFILDDSYREREETMFISLFTYDPWVLVSNESVVIRIQDQEDALHVSFASPSYIIKEPLSNYPIDKTAVTINVNIYGDTLLPDTSYLVHYYTISGSAHPGRDYSDTHGTAVVKPTDTQFNISVYIMANQKQTRNTRFEVVLYMSNHSDDVVIGPQNVTKVFIKNRILGGAFFPSPPIVVSLNKDGSIANHTYSDSPVTCVTLCQPIHPYHTQYIEECNKQGIDTTLTQYQWEISLNSIHFRPIRLDTLLTRTDSHTLSPVYFREGVWLRCTATAVDHRGVKGHRRVSVAVAIARNTSKCHHGNLSEPVIDANLTSYEDYSGKQEDLLHLSLTLSAMPNLIPIITTSPVHDHAHSLLIHNPTQLRYPCSTVSHDHRFISTLPLPNYNYHHLLSESFFNKYDSHSCTWRFSLWLPLETITDQCSGFISPHGSMSINLYIQYVHIFNNTVISNSMETSNITLSYDGSNIAPRHFPFEYYPIESLDDTEPRPYLRLISISHTSRRLHIVFQSHSNGLGILLNGTFGIRGSGRGSHTHITPVGTQSVDVNNVTQHWIIDTEIDVGGNFELIIVLYSCQELYILKDTVMCLTGRDELVYNLLITNAMDSTGRPGLGLQLQGKAVELSSSKMIIETTVSLHNSVKATFDDFRLAVTRILLCGSEDDEAVPTMDSEGCFDNGRGVQEQHIMGAVVRENNGLAVNILHNGVSSHILLHVNMTNSLVTKLPLVNKWYYKITTNASATGMTTITNDIILPILFVSEASGTATPTHDLLEQNTNEEMPLYATVLISLMLAALTLVCSITAAIVGYSVNKKYTLRRLELEATMQQNKERRSIHHGSSRKVSYKKKHVGRHIPYNKTSFQLLMRPGGHVPAHPRGTRVHWNNRQEDNGTLEELSVSPSTSSSSDDSVTDSPTGKPITTPLMPIPPTGKPITAPLMPLPPTGSPSSKSTGSINSSLRGRYNGNAPIGTVRPLSVRSSHSLPSQTLSLLSARFKSTNEPDNKESPSNIAIPMETNHGNESPQPMKLQPATAGWYERHLARKKAMDAYIKLYFGPSEDGNQPADDKQPHLA